MTKDEFNLVVAAMRGYWPRSAEHICPDAASKRLWYGSLADIDYKVCETALMELAATSAFPPAISEIRSTAARQKAPRSMLMSPAEAWALVEKAVRRSTYYAAEEFSKLPATVQRAVGSSDVLRSWAMSENPADMGVHEAIFKRSFGAIAESTMKERQISETLHAAIEARREEEPALPVKETALLDAPADETKTGELSELTKEKIKRLIAKLEGEER